MLWPLELAAQTTTRDSTICVAFRTRTFSTGAILSTSVTKVPCGGQARVDTVTIRKTDTLNLGGTPAPVPVDPRGYNCWQARDMTTPSCIDSVKAPLLSQQLVLRAYGQTFGYVRWMWQGRIYPTDPSLPSAGTVIHDTTIVVRQDTLAFFPSITPAYDSVRFTLQPYHASPLWVAAPIALRIDRYFYWWPVVGADSIRFELRDGPTGASHPPAVALPRPTSSSSTAPELPRVSVDTRMPAMPMSGDTLFQDAAGKWWCRGPTCAASLASHNLPVQLSQPPPATLPWILSGRAP